MLKFYIDQFALWCNGWYANENMAIKFISHQLKRLTNYNKQMFVHIRVRFPLQKLFGNIHHRKLLLSNRTLLIYNSVILSFMYLEMYLGVGPATSSQTVRSLWKGINCKQSTRWQHLSRLKASAFFSLHNCFTCCET